MCWGADQSDKAFDHWILQDSLRRNWMLRELLFLSTGCLRTQFFDSPWHSQLGHLLLLTPHCTAPVWLTGHYAVPFFTRCFPTQPLPREVEDFPRDSNHFKHMPLLTYLAWLQPICYNYRLVFNHINTEKVLLVVKTLIKN